MAEPGFFDSLFSPAFQTWIRDFRQHAKEHSTSLSTEGYIRLVIIVGAYCMLRPYLVKLGGRFQASDHEREIDDTAELSSPAAVSPNALRGQLDVSDNDSSEEEQVESAAPKWGKGARRRQKKAAKEEADEEDADSDMEIEKFLRKVID